MLQVDDIDISEEAILSATLQERFSFVSFGPYGPVYIQFDWKQPPSTFNTEQLDQGADLKLTANGWPVQRISKGRYRVIEPNATVEVFSDEPYAP